MIFFAFNEAFNIVGDGEPSSGAAAALLNFGSTHNGEGEKLGIDRSCIERLFSASVRRGPIIPEGDDGKWTGSVIGIGLEIMGLRGSEVDMTGESSTSSWSQPSSISSSL
jgi:hypothetical protein